jgi:hypothetical protein
LNLFLEIRLTPEILFQGEWHGFDRVGERTRAETCGYCHAQNAPQRATAIDCIHWLSPFDQRLLLQLSA